MRRESHKTNTNKGARPLYSDTNVVLQNDDNVIRSCISPKVN